MKDMKLSRIEYQDFRFYNNLFIGSSGLKPLDEKTPNVLASGNVYLDRAKPGSHDEDAWVAADVKPDWKLHETSGRWQFEMTVDPAWEKGQKRQVVTSEVLGKANIPDAAFEQPDGTPYTLDQDYFGHTRDNSNPAPGPFENLQAKSIQKILWPK